MPYKSEAQRKFMHARKPEIAKKWDAEIHDDYERAKRSKNKTMKRKEVEL